MNSLLSESMNEPSTFAAKSTFQRFPGAIQSIREPSSPFESITDARQSRIFPQQRLEPRNDALTPSVAEVKSAIREVKLLEAKEAQVDRQLFEQSK